MKGRATWRVAKSLGSARRDGLLGEVNAAAPERNRASDGAIGDPLHQARASDHNPCVCCQVVCARDFTHDPEHGFNADDFTMWLRARVLDGKEPRVRYVIWTRRIFSGPGQEHAPGVWRPYKGANPHTTHVHVSVRHPASLYDDETPWGWR